MLAERSENLQVDLINTIYCEGSDRKIRKIPLNSITEDSVTKLFVCSIFIYSMFVLANLWPDFSWDTLLVSLGRLRVSSLLWCTRDYLMSLCQSAETRSNTHICTLSSSPHITITHFLVVVVKKGKIFLSKSLFWCEQIQHTGSIREQQSYITKTLNNVNAIHFQFGIMFQFNK